MKLQFYVIFNGRGAFLSARSSRSWTMLRNPLLASMFADTEEIEAYFKNDLRSVWKSAFTTGNLCIATIIEEL